MRQRRLEARARRREIALIRIRATQQLKARVEALHADRARLFSDTWPGARRGPERLQPRPVQIRVTPTVLVCGSGPTFFELVRQDQAARVQLSDLGPDGAPDLLVIPQPERREFDQMLAAVPDRLWPHVASGRTQLVLDASSEGTPHRPETTDRQHRLLEARGVPFQDVVYITQDRLYETHYQAYCREAGLRSMRVMIYDYFLHRMLFRLYGMGEEIFKSRYRTYQNAPRRGRRRFLSLNLTPRSYKVLFLLRLLRDELWDEGYVSFGGFNRLGRANEITWPQMRKRMLQMEGFRDAVVEVAPLLPRLDEMGPILFGMSPTDSTRDIVQTSYLATGLEEYRRSWFSVVTETAMTDRVHRITEKTFKPLLNLHPFIVLAGPGSLAIVREYGFQTFDGFFDESYDLEANRRRRFEMVYGEVVRLTRVDEDELSRLEARFEEVIRFNARWGLVDLPRIFEQTIAPELIEQLMRVAGPLP